MATIRKRNNGQTFIRFLQAAWVYLVLLVLLLILLFLLVTSNERSLDINRALDKEPVSSDH